MRTAVIVAIGMGIALVRPAPAEDIFVVAPVTVRDQKAAFATVESRRMASARARIGGTVLYIVLRDDASQPHAPRLGPAANAH